MYFVIVRFQIFPISRRKLDACNSCTWWKGSSSRIPTSEIVACPLFILPIVAVINSLLFSSIFWFTFPPLGNQILALIPIGRYGSVLHYHITVNSFNCWQNPVRFAFLICKRFFFWYFKRFLLYHQEPKE